MQPLPTTNSTAADPCGGAQEIVPVPGTDHFANAPQLVRRRRRAHRKRLYRRPVFIIPLVLLMAGLSVAGVLSYRLNSAFDAAKTVSTPLPVISGSQLGGNEGVQIDTAPARAVVAASKSNTSTHDGQQRGGGNTETSGIVAAASSSQDGGTGGSAQVATAPAQALPAVANLRPTAPKTRNILLMGVDARPGESIDVGVRPDVLAVLHLNEETGSCRLLSIPRDTRVNLPGYGMTKINHALAVGGIPYEQQVVQDYLGITLDHYGLIDFAGVTQLVDAVGGVTVVNPAAFTAGGFTFDQGAIQLDGGRALAYARFRYDANGDFGRIGRQQQIIHAVMTKLSGNDLLSLTPKLLGMLTSHTKTDLGVGDILGLAKTFTSTCTADTLETKTLEGTVATYPDPLLKMDLSYVIVDPAELRAKLDWLLADR